MHAQDLFDISGKKAIVTGGTRGLGYGMAEGYMEAGCEVAIVGTSDSVFRVAEEFKSRGFKCHGVKGNLGDREDIYRVFRECLDSLGGDVDILLTAHGIQRRHSAEEFPLEEWDEVIRVNLTSIFILCQEAARVMLKKGYGKIINIASMNSFFGGQTIPAYAASKGGVAQLTKELTNDWLARGINVNAIAPGFFIGDQNRHVLINPDGSLTDRSKKVLAKTPMNRFGDIKELNGAVQFLCSEAASFVTGAMLPIDGGFSAFSGV